MADTDQLDPLTNQPDPALARPESPLAEPQSAPEPFDSLPEEPRQGPKQKDRLTEKQQWSNWTVLAMLVLCFFVIVRFRPFESRNPDQRTGVGEKLEQLRLTSLDTRQKPVTLADLTGRVVLINFWGAWSPSCEDELRKIGGLQKKYGGQTAFKLLAVSCGRDAREPTSTTRQEAKQFLAQKGINLPVFVDPGGVSRAAVNRAVGLKQIPTTVLLDRHGRIRSVWSGFPPGVEVQMDQLISQLLDEG